jgi:single-strand DNA-binding protein
MQMIIVSGNVGSDSVLRSTQGGDQVLAFNLAVKQGYGQNERTNWYRCNVWGKRGASIQQYLLKGVKAFVTGELTIGEYDGKPQYDVRVNEVEWERRQGEAQREPQRQRAPAYDDELSDSVPF